MPAVLITCACPDPEVAGRLARELVEARPAACVQVIPGMTSIYRWEGAIERATAMDGGSAENAGRGFPPDEVLLLAKTWDDRVDAVAATLQARHPYALPEIMAVPAAGGSAAYLDWVCAETRDETPE